MKNLPPYTLKPLGDIGLIIDFGNIIDTVINEKVISLFYRLKKNPLAGMTEAIPAYSSLTIFFDVVTVSKDTKYQQTARDRMNEVVEDFLQQETLVYAYEGRLIDIPVCYEKEFGVDTDTIIKENNISYEELIKIHIEKTYRVFMLGFLPGFAYMGEVEDQIASPRKHQPVPVEAGSVGIAGKQTGIYPFKSPGGWKIIGRTPLKLFDKDKSDPVLLNAGDRVRFYSISKDEFVKSWG